MLCNLIKRGLIYGYFLFIGYQLLTNLSSNKDFSDSITRFETRHETQFQKVYEKVPQLVQYKVAKYPAALVAFSALSILRGGFGIFALATHALITAISCNKIGDIVRSINLKMDFVKFAQGLDLEVLLLLALYLGVMCQVVYSIFGGCAAKAVVVEDVPATTTRTNASGKNKRH